MSNFDQYDNVENSALVLYPGDDFAFYANLDTLETDTNFANWHLDLLDEDFNIVVSDIGTLNQDNFTGGYRFYSDFVVPTGLTPMCYYLAIIDEDYDSVQYISNKLEYSNIQDYTVKIKYRNAVNILNYNYANLIEFSNLFRIKLKIRHPQNPTNEEGYTLVNGSFNPVRNTVGITKEFITLWYNEGDHDAFNSATIHSSFQVAEEGQFRLYKKQDDYQIDWNENYPLSEGTLRLQRSDTFSSNKNL